MHHEHQHGGPSTSRESSMPATTMSAATTATTQSRQSSQSQPPPDGGARRSHGGRRSRNRRVEAALEGSHLPVRVHRDQGHIYNVPRELVLHMPEVIRSLSQLTLCPDFSPGEPDASCAQGTRCEYVHADVRGIPAVNPHINYAWRSIEEVSFPRFQGGLHLIVVPPNNAAGSSVDEFDSSAALRTRALDGVTTTADGPSSSGPIRLSHCAHYYLHRRCNFGQECKFVHAIFVDPAAAARRRAPAPATFGRQPPPSQQQHPQHVTNTRAGSTGLMVAMPAQSPAADASVVTARDTASDLSATPTTALGPASQAFSPAHLQASASSQNAPVTESPTPPSGGDAAPTAPARGMGSANRGRPRQHRPYSAQPKRPPSNDPPRTGRDQPTPAAEPSSRPGNHQATNGSSNGKRGSDAATSN